MRCLDRGSLLSVVVALSFWTPHASALMEDEPATFLRPSGGYAGSYSGPTGYSGGASIELPQVTVTGKSGSDWVTVCSGSACATFMKSFSEQQNRYALRNLGLDELVMSRIATAISVSACSVLPGMPPGAREVTKNTEDVIRWRIGSQIIDAHTNNLRFINTAKTEFKVTYSDGSTEIFQYISVGSTHRPKDDSFKPGDGVPGSACVGV
jgi:hypothetical protein